MLPLLKEANSNWMDYQSYIFELFWKGKISSSDYELSKSTGKLHQDGKPLKPDTMKKQTSYQNLKAENEKLRQQLYKLTMEPESIDSIELQLLLQMKYEMANAALQGGPQRNITILREPTEKDDVSIETVDLDGNEILAHFEKQRALNKGEEAVRLCKEELTRSLLFELKKDDPEELIRRTVDHPGLFKYIRASDVFGCLYDEMSELEKLNAQTMLHNGIRVDNDLFLVHMSVARRLAEYRDEMTKKYYTEPPKKLYASLTDDILEKAKNWSADGYAMAVTDETTDEGKGVFQQIKESEPVPGNGLSRKDWDAWVKAVKTKPPGRIEFSDPLDPLFEFMTEEESMEYNTIIACAIGGRLMGQSLHNMYTSFVQRMVEKYSEQALKKQGKWGWFQETLQKIRDNWNKKV